MSLLPVMTNTPVTDNPVGTGPSMVQEPEPEAGQRGHPVTQGLVVFQGKVSRC